MNRIKRLIALVLSLCLVLCMAACGEEPVAEDSYKTDRYIPTVEDSKPVLLEDDIEHKFELVDFSGPEGYVIVVAKGDDKAKETAETLKAWYKEKANVELEIVTDDKAATDKEILIGKTSRYDFTAAEGEYFAKLEGNKLVFGGGHYMMVRKAVEIFTRLGYEKGKAKTFSGSSDFTAQKLGYTYVWGDEFEASSLNPKLWNRSTGMAATAEMTLDDTELTTKVENGFLALSAIRYWDPKKSGVEFACPWSVSTGKTMSYMYGYIEIRAKVPFIKGVWPSFWTSSSGALGENKDYDYTIEIDIFEVFSSTDTLAPNIHKWYSDGKHTMWAVQEGNSNEWYKFNSDNLINEYHTYGFEWTPTEITMYVDGEAYYTYDLTVNFDNGESGMGGFASPIALIFNNHLFTPSSSYLPYDGAEVHAPVLPAEYAIDYVRLYQKNDGVSKLYLAD